MKTIRVVGLMLVSLMFNSCVRRCDCYKVCYFYHNDSVEFCRPVYSPDSAFVKSNDSLRALYGQCRETTYGSDKVYGKSIAQFEKNGFSCVCPK